MLVSLTMLIYWHQIKKNICFGDAFCHVSMCCCIALVMHFVSVKAAFVTALLWWYILSVLEQQIFVFFFFFFFSSLSLSVCLIVENVVYLFGFLIENEHCGIAFLEIFVLLSLLTWSKVGCSLKRGDNFMNYIMANSPHCGALFKCMWTVIMSNPKMNGLILRT